MTNILVSIIIPVYNRAEILSTTLDSVVKQTYQNIEIIVIDDGSEEDIKSVIKSLNDKRLSYYKLPHVNANHARNYGIKQAKGDYIAMLDADDLWMPNHIEDCLELVTKTDADGLYGSIIVKNIFSEDEDHIIINGPREDESMINYLLRTGFGAQTSTLFLTSKSVKNILWDETLYRHQDYDFVVRYSKKYRFAVKKEPTVIYRKYNQSSSIDITSCIKVIEANEDEIEPITYINYNYNMLNLALNQRADNYLIDYYRKESTRYKEFLTFTQFLQIYMPQSEEQIETLRQEYISYIVDIEVEL